MNPRTQRYLTTFPMPIELRIRLDEVRSARARRNGGLPPHQQDLIVEALELLIEREAETSRK